LKFEQISAPSMITGYRIHTVSVHKAYTSTNYLLSIAIACARGYEGGFWPTGRMARFLSALDPGRFVALYRHDVEISG